MRVWECFSKAISNFISWLKEVCCCSSRTESSVTTKTFSYQSSTSSSSTTSIETPNISPISAIVTTKIEEPDLPSEEPELPPISQIPPSPVQNDDEEFITEGADLIRLYQGDKLPVFKGVDLPINQHPFEAFL